MDRLVPLAALDHDELGGVRVDPALDEKTGVRFYPIKRPVPEYAESEIERNPIGICD